MSFLSTTSGGKKQIVKVDAFCQIQNYTLPLPDKTFTSLLDDLDQGVKDVYPEVSTGALSNCHGDWYEWLIAIAAWNYHVQHPGSYVLLPLPNVSQFDVSRLYIDDLYELIEDLRVKVADATSVELITSNPDFVLINPASVVGFPAPQSMITNLNTKVIADIEQTYKPYIAKCGFESIIGYVSVKSSLRPDRRLQIPHEGSLVKALYIHLQTRKWIISPPGLRYYAVSRNIGETDLKALKTVATHSLTTVHSVPEAAVDEVFAVDSMVQAERMFDQILVNH
jgi:Cfr10I/Bse634I restriction endonuclease